MSLFYIVELESSHLNYNEILGKFNSLINSYEYISQYAKNNNFTIIIEYSMLSEDQKKGSIIAVNNYRRPTKLIYIRSEILKKRKLTM